MIQSFGISTFCNTLAKWHRRNCESSVRFATFVQSVLADSFSVTSFNWWFRLKGRARAGFSRASRSGFLTAHQSRSEDRTKVRLKPAVNKPLNTTPPAKSWWHWGSRLKPTNRSYNGCGLTVALGQIGWVRINLEAHAPAIRLKCCE